MSSIPGPMYDVYVKYYVDELLRQAEHDRIADMVAQPRRPLRVRLAEHLRAVARWIEGSPRLANA